MGGNRKEWRWRGLGEEEGESGKMDERAGKVGWKWWRVRMMQERKEEGGKGTGGEGGEGKGKNGEGTGQERE